MKKIIPLLLFFCISSRLSAQDFTGQWKGEFVDKSAAFVGWGGDHCDYVLEIECRGTKVTGYSYTYFSDGGKRYYTICKLEGTLNKKNKYLEVKETVRTKTNVPVNIRNCFQIHRLTYFEQDSEQTLEGTWVPVPNQAGDCGFGSTVLSRRILKKNPSLNNNNTAGSEAKKTSPPVVKTPPKKTSPPVVKAKPKLVPEKPVAKTESKDAIELPVPKADTVKTSKPPTKTELSSNNLPTHGEADAKKTVDPRYEKRNNDLIKTIEIDNPTFTVALYDNGEIDGDSISLLFNGRLLLAHKRLSDKALQLKLDVDPGRDVNELIMYAENLGTIPPNTALMVVYDGDNRYEVRISSDLQKSGVIRFVHKSKKEQ
ncbi:MAG: hypothetical protein IPL84_01030 [Chitinophagaceae bacterium]|nr:hypothetical protein [Chitinophagaceae bacterium]